MTHVVPGPERTVGPDNDDYRRMLAALGQRICPNCGNQLDPCRHGEFHTGRTDDLLAGDCSSCKRCWTLGKRQPPTQQYDEDNKHVKAALSEGICPDCGTSLIPCTHSDLHRGDDKVFGDCEKCTACWTYGPAEETA